MHSSITSTSSPTIENPSQPTTRPKRLSLSHFRRSSQPLPRKEKPASAYEAWIDNALLQAHSPPDIALEEPASMARGRASTAANGDTARHQAQSSGDVPLNLEGLPKDEMPTIKLIPHQDPRSNRPSLVFPITTRQLPHEDCVIRVGRYSERDVNPNPTPNTPSSSPIGFKSKVVSRRHCEFWCSRGQWYIKDVKSSSGTFLNHIRLSQPSIESKPFPVNDGDVVQLGIDFRGGEEMIFRCVKIRVECNRGWQKTLNKYNLSTHKTLRDLGKTKPKDSDAASSHSSQECAICLLPIAPCQSLFVAPCSHVWHYKCVRTILNDHKQWPQFLCPNCRSITDLDADPEDLADFWEDDEDLPPQNIENPAGNTNPFRRENEPSTLLQPPLQLNGDTTQGHTSISDPFASQNGTDHIPTVTANSDSAGGAEPSASLLERRMSADSETSSIRIPSGQMDFLRPITPTQPFMGDDDIGRASSHTPIDILGVDGPMTPTNNAGPFVFDGSAGRSSGSIRRGPESSTDNTMAAT